MAEFDVTLSAMEEAKSNVLKYSEEFKEQADQTFQAAQALSGSWVGDASQTFVENMNQIHKWMVQLSATLDEYGESLGKSRETYENADMEAAKNFRR